MLAPRTVRYAAIAALGAMLVLWGEARAVLPPNAVEGLKAGAAEVIEVKVLEAQKGQGERFEVLYRMDVLSVLRSASRVQAGETVTVRSYGLSKEALARGFVGPKVPALLAPGWVGTAYLNRDPEASGAGAKHQFAIAAHGDSFVELPPRPPPCGGHQVPQRAANESAPARGWAETSPWIPARRGRGRARRSPSDA